MRDDDSSEGRAGAEGRVLSVHFGRSANCSSVGSVVDVLFVSSTAGAAILAGLALYLAGRGAEADTGTGTGTDTETETETET